jgi:hypothetical protein
MKKVLYLFAAFVLFSSCLSLGRAPDIHWSLGAYTDEWGDRTGEYFTKYDGAIKALFSNNEDATITELEFSRHEGLSFHIPTAAGRSPIMASDVELIIKTDDGTEINFSGRSTGPRNGRNIFIPFSDDLLNALLNENIRIRLSYTGRARYQFDFPKNFGQAYDRLVARENIQN